VTSTTAVSERVSFSSAILLVEDEPVLRSSIARGLGKLTNVEVCSAANVGEAIALIDTRAPSLVISDIDLPGATGLELIGELKRRKIEIPIIFVTAYLKTYRAQIPTHPNVLVLEKPVPLEELRSRVLRLLGPAGKAARGPFGVVDFVQLACLGRHSVRIEIERVGDFAGVTVHEGEIWSAEDSQGIGPEAFKRLAFGAEATVTCSSLVAPPGPRTITMRWEQLLLESARTFDESNREPDSAKDPLPPSTLSALAATPLPEAQRSSAGTSSPTRTVRPPPIPSAKIPPASVSAPAVPKVPAPLPKPTTSSAQSPAKQPARPARPPSSVEPPPAEKLPSFDELWNRGVDALLCRDFALAVQAFSTAAKLRPHDPAVKANLLRLRQMGHIKDGEDQT
jgi:CheY-like chemotaxis protein